MSINIGLIVVHTVILIFVFLFLLTGHLRGAWKGQIENVLIVIIIGLLIFIGFKYGLIAVFLSIPICLFVYAPLTNILAKYVSFKILGYRTNIKDEKPLSAYDLCSGKISGNREEFFNSTLKKKSIQKVLQQYGKTEDDLKEHFWKLMMSGLGDLSYDIISNPKSLNLLFQLKKEGVSDLAIARRKRKGTGN